MAFNKKVLSKAVSELGKAKAPAKPKDIITDPAGQWKYPGQETRIPGNDITMQGVPYPVWAQPNVGPGSMMQPNQDYNFPNASYVDETPMVKNGGEADYEDLELTDEEIQAYRDGGYVVEELPEAQAGGPQNTAGPKAEEIPANVNAMNAMMKARMATDAEFGNPAARRMTSPNPKTYDFGNGDLGTHFMASMGNQAVPLLQDKGDDELEYNENPPPSKEDMNFRTPEEAQYFAEHYKEVAPMMRGFKQGGYVQHELVKAQNGKIVYSGPKFGLVGPSTPKTNGAPTIANAKILEAERQKAALAKQQALAKQKKDELMRGMPKTQVSDNTRTVIPNQAISNINNAAFYNSPQETANREARKKEQAAFEKEQWNKYNKMSFAEKALDRTQAAIAHPFLMAGNALAGNQGYIPGMGRGLMNTESPEYDKYLKATGQTKGQFEISDLANIVNPGYWAGNAGNELHKGNYIKGVTDLGFGLMGLKGAKNVSGLVKGSANVLNKAESKISKLIPERAAANSTKDTDKLVDLYRIQEKGARPMAELAAEGKLGKSFQNEKAIKHFKDREEHFGQWFTKDKSDFDFYKADREFTNPEIINLKVPESELTNYSNYNKSLSRATDREFVIPHDKQSQYINASSNAGNLNAGISPQLIKNTIGTGNKVGANILNKAYFSPFFSKAFNRYSPLNLIKGYGSKLEGAVKPLGNVLGKSIKNNKLTGSKPLFGKVKELSTQVGKTDASNIYAAKFDDAVEGSNIRLGEANPQGRFSRKSNATFPIQTKAGVNRYDLPISDPGVALHRRLPFSNKYVPIDKQKLMNNKFQWSTTGAGLQNVAEKYGKGVVGSTLGYGAYNAYNYNKNDRNTYLTPSEIETLDTENMVLPESEKLSRAEMFKRGAKEAYESPLNYAKNPYFVNDIYQALKSAPEEKNGGSIESWEDDLDEEEIRLLKEAGFIVEELK